MTKSITLLRCALLVILVLSSIAPVAVATDLIQGDSTAIIAQQEQFTLAADILGNGSVTFDPAGGTYDPGTEVTLTAEPAAGWIFDGWSCNYRNTVLEDAPIAYWRLDEASGMVAANGGSLGCDVYGTYGTGVTLGATSLVPGDPNPAAGFDGTSGSVTIPNNDAINTLGPYSAKTIELWFEATALTGKQVLYEQGGEINGLNIFLEGNQLFAGAWVSNQGSWTSTTVSVGTAYHVALVFDGGAPALTAYLNGVSFGTLSTAFTEMPTHSGGIGIGAINDNTRYSDSEDAIMLRGAFFDGTIDEVALYDRVLSAVEIQHHAAGCSGTPSGTTNPTTITMDHDKIVTAAFVEQQHTLTVNVDGNGSVTLDPLGGTYDHNTDVSLTAMPAEGWIFDGWTGLDCEYGNSVLADTPIAYWRLGETGGTVAANSGTLGCEVNGSYESFVILGATSFIPGDPDPAAGFDATDGYVMIPNHDAINTLGPYYARTIELWFRANAPGGKQVLYEEGGYAHGFTIFLDGYQLYLGAFANNIGYWATTTIAGGELSVVERLQRGPHPWRRHRHRRDVRRHPLLRHRDGHWPARSQL